MRLVTHATTQLAKLRKALIGHGVFVNGQRGTITDCKFTDHLSVRVGGRWLRYDQCTLYNVRNMETLCELHPYVVRPYAHWRVRQFPPLHHAQTAGRDARGLAEIDRVV